MEGVEIQYKGVAQVLTLQSLVALITNNLNAEYLLVSWVMELFFVMPFFLYSFILPCAIL